MKKNIKNDTALQECASELFENLSLIALMLTLVTLSLNDPSAVDASLDQRPSDIANSDE